MNVRCKTHDTPMPSRPIANGFRYGPCAQCAADAWNATHPIGTDVYVTRDSGAVMRTRTRSVAWVICDHASVMVDGISGGYLLERVRPVAAGLPDGGEA